MKLIFDRITLQQVDTESPMTFSVNISDETKLTKTVHKTRMIPQQPQHIYETIDTIVQIPVLQEDGTELLVDTVETTVVRDEWVEMPDLEENYEEVVPITELSEILAAKFEYITKQNNCEYAYADEFLTEEDIDLTVEGHSANTGVKILEVLPHGFCQTKPITLDVPAKTFKLYHESALKIQINGVDFIDNIAVFESPIDTFVLRFINDTSKKIMGKSYAVMYNMEVE